MATLQSLRSLFAILLLLPSLASAQVMKKSSCAVPLNERKSAPSIDLITQDGTPIDRDTLIDMINAGKDTSSFEPQLSDFYVGTPLSPIAYNTDFPSDENAVKKPLQFVSYAEVDHFTQARVTDPDNEEIAYNLTVTYDINAAVARNALLRKLGYNIPSPKLYRKLSVTFPDLDTRDEFLVRIARLRDIGIWVDGGSEEVNKKNLTVTLLNVALESALLVNIPPMHWGIFKSETQQSRRPFRALLAPLTLLDIDESVNMYPFEPAKIENNNLVFSRVYANVFKNETTLGDVKWIAKRIAKLTREDWISIIRAGQYPADIEALIVEKTIGRTNQLMKLLQIDFQPLYYNPNISYGNIINGKAYQSRYDGYPHSFAYGDPLNPLRLSEMARYFGVELISNAIKFALDSASKYLQVWSPDTYVKKHQENFYQEIINFSQTHPGETYVQPVSAWGGPIAGGGVSANRSVVAGTYYGSTTSPVQMVDSISVNARVGAFIGISGLKNLGVSISPTLSYNRSYVHVRPINDIKTALKDNWTHVAVPFSMLKLSNVLLQKESQDAQTTIDNFLKEMKTGEMFMIIDGFTISNNTMLGIPVGAMLGGVGALANISETINGTNQYAITSRTTIYKSEKGLQIYLSNTNTWGNEISADTDFFLRIFSMGMGKSNGFAHTDAYVFPSEFSDDTQRKSFQYGVRSILRSNNSSLIEENFRPFVLDHDASSKKLKFKIGPWQWTRRETIHKLEIAPPIDPQGRYDAQANKRTVIQGQINKINGWDFYGFFGSILNKFVSFLNIGGGSKGDDPASNFMGKSKSLIVSTELETTDSRPNNTLVRIQQTYAGWTMRKKKLMKLLDSISQKLDHFNPNGELVDADSFTQTKRIQAYNVVWNLSIYEPGVEKLLSVLNSDIYNTKAATNFMANLMGMDEYNQYCKDHGRTVGFMSGPVSLDLLDNSAELAIETTNKGQTTVVTCVTPWMQSVFDLRDKLRKHQEIFAKDVHDEDVAQNKVHWINKSLMKLESEIDLSLLIKWIGVDQCYFQVSVAGYRKGDERAQDEEGRSTYFSNTIGSINSEIRNGPIDDISKSSQITQHELIARYLSDGF